MIRPRSLRVRFLALTSLAAAVAVALASCGTPPQQGGAPATPSSASIRNEPGVRVRVMNSVPAVTVAGSRLTLRSPGAAPASFTPPVRVTRQAGAFVVTDGRNASVRWPGEVLEIDGSGGPLQLGSSTYPGTLVLHPAGTGIEVVNHVPIEQYLPGVLERELYASWPPEAFAAQAIAARSYAIAQRATTANRHYDLESTVASQVYGGKATNAKAIDAVNRTRGQVLTYNGRVLTAFFSASSGGVSQDAQAAFPDKQGSLDIPPLRGRPHGWGKSSNNFTWGPIRRDVRELSQRIAAWGRTNGNPVANLATLTRVDVIARSGSGRPATFQLTDSRGMTYRLAAEHFRFACNADAPGLTKLESAQQVKSSFLEIRLAGGAATFTGRGHGHGVGLDQWAARDMATQGYTGQQIAAFFYPGAQIQQLY